MATVKDWPSAARLYGASEAQRERMGMARDRADEQFSAPLMAQVRQALGETAYVEITLAGGQLGLASALSEAQDWLRAKS